jgi:Domain of unknown function (DUF4129)
MSRKVSVAALLLLAICALAAGVSAEGGAETQVKAMSAPGDSQASEAAHRVFEGSQFWWKHRTKIEDPSINLGFMAFVKRCIGAVLDFLKSVVRRIFEFLRSLMPSWIPRLPVSGATSGLKWGLAAVALAAIGVIVYQFLKRRRLAIDTPAQPLAEPERLPDAVLLIARAKAALEAGDTFEALRLGFQAVLAVLEDRGIVRYDPARTNSEYYRDLRPRPALAADFRRISLPFDRAFYGKIRPEAGDVEQTLKFCESLTNVGVASS